MDEVAFALVFLILIPAFALCYKYVKVSFIKTIARRYQTGIIHELMLLVYLKVSITALLQY